MKLSSLFFSTAAFAATVASAFQNLQSSDAQLNISSPIQNGVYVAGKALPLTYIPATLANLNLNIYLRGINVSFNETVLAANADVSNGPEYAIYNPENQSTYYQHSINYDIPATTPAGNYEVIYHNAITNVNTSIPISILVSAVPSSTVISFSQAVTAFTEPSATPNLTSVSQTFSSIAPTESTFIQAV